MSAGYYASAKGESVHQTLEGWLYLYFADALGDGITRPTYELTPSSSSSPHRLKSILARRFDVGLALARLWNDHPALYDAIEMHYGRGWSQETIARNIHKSHETIKKRLEDGTAYLLRDLFGPPGRS